MSTWKLIPPPSASRSPLDSILEVLLIVIQKHRAHSDPLFIVLWESFVVYLVLHDYMSVALRTDLYVLVPPDYHCGWSFIAACRAGLEVVTRITTSRYFWNLAACKAIVNDHPVNRDVRGWPRQHQCRLDDDTRGSPHLPRIKPVRPS